MKLLKKLKNTFSDFRKDKKEDQCGQHSRQTDGHGVVSSPAVSPSGMVLSSLMSTAQCSRCWLLPSICPARPSVPPPSLFDSSLTSSTEHQGPVRLATQGSCQKDSDPLVSLSLCLTQCSLSASIKAAFWKLIWKGGTSGGTWSGGSKERGRDGGRAGEGKGQGGVMRECDSE